MNIAQNILAGTGSRIVCTLGAGEKLRASSCAHFRRCMKLDLLSGHQASSPYAWSIKPQARPNSADR